MKKLLILIVVLYCNNVIVQCVPTTTEMSFSQSGFAFEMIIAKFQSLEFYLIEKDLQTEEKITVLNAKMDSLVKSIDNLAWIAQQTGETVSELGLNGKITAHNLTVIQRDLTDLVARQQLLATTHQLGQYLLLRGCNTTNLSLITEERRAVYSSCNKIPYAVSGVYRIRPEKPFKEPITVLCDQEYESGGWVVIQNRFDGSTNFYRSWQEYKDGFGNLDGEFWLGLDRIYQLTVSGPHELVVLLEDFDGNKTFAKYDEFEIGNESQKYALMKLSGYAGTAGDSLGASKGLKFSTFDSDNDPFKDNYAKKFTGSWWYGLSHLSNLNGKYLHGSTKEFATSVVWKTFRGNLNGKYLRGATKEVARGMVWHSFRGHDFVICCATITAQNVNKSLSCGVIQCGYVFEIITNRLQILEKNFTEKQLQTEGVIADLSARIDSLLQQNCTTINPPSRNQTKGAVFGSCSNAPGLVSGVYQIQSETPFKEPITVLCDQEYESGGWVVIQQRFNGSINFYRNWKEYRNGFGNLDGEFWLGLERIYQLTVTKPHELVVLLEDFGGNKTFARYDEFEIAGESQQYALLKIDGYWGPAGDSLGSVKGMKFSTLDVDNDTWNGSCAITYTGAWWYSACHSSNLNGKYLRGETKKVPNPVSGVQKIQLEKPFKQPIVVLCDQEYESGGWVLTVSGSHELVVLLDDFDENRMLARYDEFETGNESQKYALMKLPGYTGTAGDSLGASKRMKFSTFDSDNNTSKDNDAKKITGAWWYGSSHWSWQQYKDGFGNLDGEFWLGLDRIYQLTVSGPHELVVLLEDFDGNKTFAKYDVFEIGNESQKYKALKIDGYTGTAGDSMENIKGMMFSTFDSDNDVWNDNCAVAYTGAWWYRECQNSNLNGKYLRGATKGVVTGMVWYTFRGHEYALKSSRMMIRPKTHN
uniref:Fibrinogen C-terminal domain-containing protein n=1 Tax=Anopheles dirus TaxID=7168 RepID=A0A182N216_9DIPT